MYTAKPINVTVYTCVTYSKTCPMLPPVEVSLFPGAVFLGEVRVGGAGVSEAVASCGVGGGLAGAGGHRTD